MKEVIVSFLLFVFALWCLCLFGNESYQLPSGVSLPMPSLVPTSETELAQQKRLDVIHLMQLMNVPEGDTSLHYSNWSFPTSIAFNAVLYNVVTGLVNTFDIVLAYNCNSNVADGYIAIKENEKEARIAAFAEMASCSIPIDSIYSDYSFTPVSSGFMRLGLSNQVTPTHEVFTSKNITVCIRAATNAVDFARELINAGLPEAERIPLPPAP